MKQKFAGKSSMMKQVDVLWVRYSSNCVIGVVREDIEAWKHILADKNHFSNSPIALKWFTYYHLLFHHMGQDQEAARGFIDRFMTELVPNLREKSHRSFTTAPISARWRV
jgi:hypothetical protein